MSSDFVSILVAARWGSVGLMVIVLVMMTYILCLRAVLLMRERRYAKLSARWTPILLEGGARNPRPLPAVAPGERLLLLILWNTLRERTERDAEICHWMGRVAAVTKIDRLARRLLRRRSVRKTLLGLATLGPCRGRLPSRTGPGSFPSLRYVTTPPRCRPCGRSCTSLTPTKSSPPACT